MKKEFTATVYVIQDQKVLLLYHRKLQKWLPPGGHVEDDETPPQAARREVLEETGLHIEFMTQENIWVECWNARSFERPYLCLLEEIPLYRDIPAHQHMDMVYVAHPMGMSDPSFIAEDELHWFSLEELNNLKPDIEIFNETLQVIHQILLTFVPNRLSQTTVCPQS